MNAIAKVKLLILLRAREDDQDGDLRDIDELQTQEEIENAYNELVESDDHWDAMDEVRCGQCETDIPPETSRHYESKSVASKLPDGSWVGWTYWYGGGKHGNPEEIEWIEEAYSLDCEETQKTVVWREFKKSQ